MQPGHVYRRLSLEENVCKIELTGLFLQDNRDLSCRLSVREWFYECGVVRFDKIVGHEGVYESGSFLSLKAQ